MSYTPERAQIVDFVHPYYYSAGTTLFAPNNTIDASAGWSGLWNKTVCVGDGNYAIEVLQNTSYNIHTLIIPSNYTEQVFDQIISWKIASKQCIGVMFDSSVASYAGFFQSGLPPLAVGPLGIITTKNESALNMALSAALVDMMSQGEQSEILGLEQQWMVANGVPVNPDLAYTVNAVSDFGIGGNEGSGGSSPGPAPSSDAHFLHGVCTSTTTIIRVIVTACYMVSTVVG